jgi:hypothetical protein
MAENEQQYLGECMEEGICPACHQPITKKFGSGRFEDGVFCSMDCYAEWHKGSLIRRHQDRLAGGMDE